MDYKIGDKIYCKKSYKGYNFTIGKIYEIYEISNKHLSFNFDQMLITNDEYHNISFYIIEQHKDVMKLDEHFITINELRKLKLEKINGL